jgi:hypothetical protein
MGDSYWPQSRTLHSPHINNLTRELILQTEEQGAHSPATALIFSDAVDRPTDPV